MLDANEGGTGRREGKMKKLLKRKMKKSLKDASLALFWYTRFSVPPSFASSHMATIEKNLYKQSQLKITFTRVKAKIGNL